MFMTPTILKACAARRPDAGITTLTRILPEAAGQRGRRHQSFARRSRSAFMTTETELSAIAAPAKIGESSRPKGG